MDGFFYKEITNNEFSLQRRPLTKKPLTLRDPYLENFLLRTH